MKRYVYSLAAVSLLGCCMPVLAQGFYGDPLGESFRSAGRYIDGGYTVPAGEAANFMANGWNFGGGIQFRLPPGPVSLRLDFDYSKNNATKQLLSEGAAANRTQINHGWTELYSNDIDVVYEIPLSHSTNMYVMAGGGGAIRRISLTQTVGAGGPYCNDWAGFCDLGSHPGDVLVDARTTGRWEWNAGVGFSFRIGNDGDAFFIEARYMEMETPVPTMYIPLRAGILFHD